MIESYLKLSGKNRLLTATSKPEKEKTTWNIQRQEMQQKEMRRAVKKYEREIAKKNPVILQKYKKTLKVLSLLRPIVQ